jgi:diguanylate cyclase (GGDEF)-like protein
VRWGGEEMLVVLPDTDLDGSILVGEKLRKTVGEIRFDQDVTITISLGASEVAETEEFTTTLARADMNLYVAKASGRNCTRPVHHEKRT